MTTPRLKPRKSTTQTQGQVLGVLIWMSGRSLTDIAQDADITVSHLCNIVRGRSRLMPYHAEALAKVLRFRAERLMRVGDYVTSLSAPGGLRAPKNERGVDASQPADR